MTEELYFIYNWQQRIKFINIQKLCPQESHFCTLKITEDIMRMNRRVDISSLYTEGIRGLGKKI